MYGELRIALNNVASQFGQLALQLGESGHTHTKARAVINNVKKLHEIDDYCTAHYFARNTDPLIKALAFNTSDYDDDFVNAVVIGATGYACGYYPTIMVPETVSADRYLAEDVVIRNKLGKHIPLKKLNQLIAICAAFVAGLRKNIPTTRAIGSRWRGVCNSCQNNGQEIMR